MSFERSNLVPCSECGRLISKREGATLCSRCLKKQTPSKSTPQKEDTQPKIILTPLEETEASFITEKSETTDNQIQVKLCSMCGKHHTLPDRDLCLSCTLDMYKGFKEAVKEIVEEKKESASKKNHLAYTSERRMEPFRRVRTQGLTWIKGYNLH